MDNVESVARRLERNGWEVLHWVDVTQLLLHPALSAETDPVTALTVSLDLKVRMDVVALVEILASIANSHLEGGEKEEEEEEEEEEQAAEAGQEEEEEEGREERKAADDAALLTNKILLARLLAISTNKGNKISRSGDNVLPDSIPSSTSPTSRAQAPRKWTWQAGRWHC